MERKQILELGPWLVEWWPQADRHAYGISRLHRGEWRSLFSSLEGKPDEPWPVSPPMQQLVQDPGQGSATLLGVGMAGSSHWSLSISLASQRKPTLLIETAIRVRQKPDGWIGSHFSLSEGVSAFSQDGGVSLQVAGEQLGFMEPLEGARIEWVPGMASLSVSPPVLGEPFPCTGIWNFRLGD